MGWMYTLWQKDNIMSWFTPKKKKGLSIEQRLDQLEHQLTVEKEDKQKLEAELTEATAELTVLREKHQEYEDRRNSPEPWVEVIGESIDPVRGIEIKLDWNDAFIQYLKENGITAKDEDTAVQKWLAFLYQDLMDKFEQKIVDNSDRKTVSDYL